MHYLNITKKNVVKIFHKDFVPGNGSGVGGSGMLMKEEKIVKLVKEEKMADLELHVCGNVIDQEDLYKFDEEALDLVLKEEARESRAHEEWLEKSGGGGALGALGANKAITHPIIAIFLYPLRAVKAAFALEVDAMGALDLMEVEAVEALDLVEAVEALDLVEAVGALDLVELEAVGALDLVEVEAVGALDLVEVEAVGALDLVEVEALGALDLVEVGAPSLPLILPPLLSFPPLPSIQPPLLSLLALLIQPPLLSLPPLLLCVLRFFCLLCF
uniref:Uncharacterized protein n=1 Tax=Tanacetum cinerariifolium TaxID=118510 RepID=A0A699IMV6_TANCI|nr:hypothetical protein [Tanacetum cinerariifolium]